jgi:hypothetical protein
MNGRAFVRSGFSRLTERLAFAISAGLGPFHHFHFISRRKEDVEFFGSADSRSGS